MLPLSSLNQVYFQAREKVKNVKENNAPNSAIHPYSATYVLKCLPELGCFSEAGPFAYAYVPLAELMVSHESSCLSFQVSESHTVIASPVSDRQCIWQSKCKLRLLF